MRGGAQRDGPPDGGTPQADPRELREWYRELFGAESTSRCKQQLVRRLSWKLQALAHGDLSERARCRIATESGALPAPSSGASFEISQDPN